MNDDSICIKFQSHFKLYILLKDKIIFESALADNSIDFYLDENQASTIDGFRYFFKDADSSRIDRILIENKIAAGTDTLPNLDFIIGRKIQEIYIMVGLIVVALCIIVASFF